jgi:hypothetical protein
MDSQGVGLRTIAALLALVALVFALFSLPNVRSYRARIVARLLRTDNWPAVVPLCQQISSPKYRPDSKCPFWPRGSTSHDGWRLPAIAICL